MKRHDGFTAGAITRPAAPATRRAGEITRRAFLERGIRTGGALLATTAFGLPLATAAARDGSPHPAVAATAHTHPAPRAAVAPVVAFFDGQLWLDTSGTSIPYEPPRGARGAAAVASMTDEELRRLHLYL